MDEFVLRMVGNKLVVEIPLAHALEAVAGTGKVVFELSAAQLVQAVRDAGPPAAQPGAKPGRKPGPKPAGPATT